MSIVCTIHEYDFLRAQLNACERTINMCMNILWHVWTTSAIAYICYACLQHNRNGNLIRMVLQMHGSHTCINTNPA